MLSWLIRRREVARQTDADATALVVEYSASAYAEAHRRQEDALDAEETARWRHAVAIARRIGKRIGLDTATRLADDADLTAAADAAKVPSHALPSGEIDPLDELSATIARRERRGG